MLTGDLYFRDLHPSAEWIWLNKFRVLLFMLIGMLCFYPYLQAVETGKTVFEVLFTALLFVSTYVLCDSRKDTVVALIFGNPESSSTSFSFSSPSCFTLPFQWDFLFFSTYT